MSVIYILHFVEKLAHAQHYTGCTESLRERLTAHANGAGARLTRELADRGIEWTLGGLMTTTKANMRRLERKLKNIAHADRYCELCNKIPLKLPGTQSYPIAALNFQANSWTLRNNTVHSGQITVRQTNNMDGQPLTLKIKTLMKQDKDALGFIPAGGEQGLSYLLASGRIIIAERNQELVGYAAYTNNVAGEQTNIHQCCVKDTFRLFGIGRRMIDLIHSTNHTQQTLAKVRDDLAANHFWQAIGFEMQCQLPHATSGKPINHYLFNRKDA